jgi:hypothetical protein
MSLVIHSPKKLETNHNLDKIEARKAESKRLHKQINKIKVILMR